MLSHLINSILDGDISVNFLKLEIIRKILSFFQVVQLENHVIDLYFVRRKSTNFLRSSARSRQDSETLRNSFGIKKSFKDDKAVILKNTTADFDISLLTRMLLMC